MVGSSANNTPLKQMPASQIKDRIVPQDLQPSEIDFDEMDK